MNLRGWGRYVGRNFVKGVLANPKENDNIILFSNQKNIKSYGEENHVALEKIQSCDDFYKINKREIA